jgi:hypothetical protein
LSVGVLTIVLLIGQFDKPSKNLLVDDVIKILPGPTWCLENKPVQEDAKRDAEIASCATVLEEDSSTSTLKATKEHHDGRSLHNFERNIPISNLLVKGPGQKSIHLGRAFDLLDFKAKCAKAWCNNIQHAVENWSINIRLQ